jgi:hypothetical protein
MQGVLSDMELTPATGGGWACRESLSHTAGGLSYAQMVEAAEAAHLRRALWQMAEALADLFEEVSRFAPGLKGLPVDDEGPSWDELSRRWMIS